MSLSLETLRIVLFFSGTELGSSSCGKAKNERVWGGRERKKKINVRTKMVFQR